MKSGFFSYIRAAFNARPFGMFIPPNWIMLAAFGLLGLANPGFWLIGAGVEVAYLAALASNPRFQRTVEAKRISGASKDWQDRHDELVKRLNDADRLRYDAMVNRCRSILEQQQQSSTMPAGLDATSESLGRLTWTYLQLLVTRQAIARILRDPAEKDDGTDRLAQRIRDLEAQLAKADLSQDLRKSLSGQAEILRQRLKGRSEGKEKLDFVEAELGRIREQVELLREQAALATDPDGLSARIDEITATLGGTAQWIKDQQQTIGSMDDLLLDPPALSAQAARGKVAQ